MKRITKQQAIDLISSSDDGGWKWSIRIEKTGVGDYGRSETYSMNGKPVVRIEIDFTAGGKAQAFDVRPRNCCIGNGCGAMFLPHGKTSSETGVLWAERYCPKCLKLRPRMESVTEKKS